MSEHRMLIVGAGALGMTCAYHLQLAGVDISFLVRPHRQEVLSRPQKIYCYNDQSIKLLEGYRVFTAAEELQGQHFDFVMLTLDGATCRSEQGVATLAALGQALANTGANLVICGVGIGLYEHVKKTTGFDKANLLQGTMRMFAYQVEGADMPMPSPTNIKLHNSADIAYLSFADGAGFFVGSTPNKASKAFAQLWQGTGTVHCKRMPTKLYVMFSNTFFPFTTACVINGWQGTDSLIADQELWQLCCDAQREIMCLKSHGILGKLFSKLMNNTKLEKTVRDTERDAVAMGYTAFNRLHHGGKVEAQNIQIMENCVAAGERDGQPMTAVKTLLSRWYQCKQ